MAKKGIIYETLNPITEMQKESREDGFMHLSGVFGVCGVRNNNHRVYETSNYAKMVESMQSRLPIPGELEHPQTMNFTMDNISHRIDKISIDENGVVSGEITLLNTPKGKIAQAIVEGGLPLYISSRAQGQVDRNGNVTLETLQTYDLVGSPGFSQAELHLNENQCFESLNESMCFIGEGNYDDDPAEPAKTNENKDMDAEQLKQIQEQLENLKSQVEYLTEQNNLLQEQLDEKPNFDLEQLANGIQNWIVEEYSPSLQKWIVEEYTQKVQNWVVEQYSQEVQNWCMEQLAPNFQDWVVEHYSPEVQKWCVESLCPEIQNWIVEEYSGTLQNWLNEHFTEDMKKNITESLQKEIKESKENKLSNIDSILEMLENTQAAPKPVYGRKGSMINEGQNGTPKYITDMPADIRVKYDLASQDVKESIDRRAKIYDFSNHSVQEFWESVSFEAPATKNLVTEGLENITDEREKALRMQIRAWRNR